MKKEQKQLIVIIAGVVILAAVLISNRRNTKKKGGGSAPEETVVSEDQQEPSPEESPSVRPKIPPAVLKKQQAAAAEPYGRDPFTLPSSGSESVNTNIGNPKQGLGSISLNAISIREGAAPMAVINGSIAQIGDKIGDVEIAGIYKNYVLLKKGGREYKLELEK